MFTDVGATLEAVIRAAGDAIVIADADGGVLRWNPAAGEMFGYREAEMVGRSLTSIIPERYRDAHRAGIARVAGGGETHVIGHTVELTGLHRDGHEFPIELSLATWEGEDGRFFSGIIRDITDRKQAEHNLAASEARLEAILRSANDAIVSLDAVGTVILWNPEAADMFGYAEDEMVGNALTSVIPERHREAHRTGVARVAGGGETHVIGHTVELTGLHRDGHEFPIELSLATWEGEDGRFFSGIIRDITDRKDAEESLRLANQTLAEKNDELQGLSAKLAKYLSRQVYDSIFTGRTDVRVESYRKLLTVFFSDIQGFTELTDRMEAEPLSELLNNYLSDMSRIALEHGGTIDKFIGDGIMIFFGDPDSAGEKEDAVACARMALEMRARVFELKHDWQRQAGSVPLHVRMGINTGYCTVGNFGSEDRLDYTIVGKEVNVASRLENSARPDQIHVSHDTYELIRDEITCRPVGEIKVKGLAYPIRTYEALGRVGEVDVGAIDEDSGAFRLALDPTKLAPAEADAARVALRKALSALDPGAGDG